MRTGKRLWLMLALIGGVSAGMGGKVVRAQEEPPPGVEYAADPGVVYPTAPPPDLIPEYPPPAPGYGYVWVNGYWDWIGYEWTWNSGFWAPRQAGFAFYAPRFVFVNGEPVYYRGYWADPYGRREYRYGWRGAPPPAWRARPSVAPSVWRTQHAEGWRRVPGAPTVWRAPARREFAGGRPGVEPRRVEHGPVVGRPPEPGRPVGGMRPAEPMNRGPMGGMPHGAAEPPHQMGGPMAHSPAPMPAPHQMGGPMPRPAAPAAAPHPAAPPAPHPAPGPHRK